MEDLKKYTLLIVDDEEMLRNALIFEFKRMGFTVFSAENGVEALKLIKMNKIHLVILDMLMPGGDGMGLLESIRAWNPETPHVIFISGGTDVTEAQCMARGARKVILKPFGRKVLMDSVLDALGVAHD